VILSSINEHDNNPETRMALFQKREIRRTMHNNELWFVITDIIAALTDSADPQGYLKDMRRRDPELSKGWGQIATPFYSDNRWPAKTQLCKHRGDFPYHPVYGPHARVV
jgi:hypothetical protein